MYLFKQMHLILLWVDFLLWALINRTFHDFSNIYCWPAVYYYLESHLSVCLLSTRMLLPPSQSNSDKLWYLGELITLLPSLKIVCITEDEMVGWHDRLDGYKFEQALGIGDGQGSLVCCSPWGLKESDTTEWLKWLINNFNFLTPIDVLNLIIPFTDSHREVGVVLVII